MSTASAVLERLCTDCGIATAYHDIWGTWHQVSEASQRALLKEFGVDASTHERATRAAGALRAARWREALPPVLAIVEGRAPWRSRIRTPLPAGSLHWQLEEESGMRHAGVIDEHLLHEIGREEIDGTLYAEFELEFGAALPSGYHYLRLLAARHALGEALVVAAPERCYRPGSLADGARVWGPAVQLYALRSERNWGIGDFGDLARLVEEWAALGAGIVGLNPLHALSAHDPAHASPYSPSSREHLNPLYLNVEAIDDFRDCEEARRQVRSAGFQALLARLREAPMVDYPGVAAAKAVILERIYAHFREHHLAAGSVRGRAFREFQMRAGVALRRHALFEALQAHFHAADPSAWGWHRWLPEYRDPASEAVARFAADEIERVEYFEYLQWEAERQLAEVGARCAARGLALGLYLDLAVSVDRAGADAWSNQEGYALGASIGAPPDDFNPNGQNWGLPPPRPDRSRTGHCEIFRRALARNMRHAGALRIDHVMGLMRLFWIPPGATARDGAYVHYAFDELLAIVVLESHRNRCMVIGEDLGTVPDAVREGLARAGALCSRLLYFERDAEGGFRAGMDYPREALIAVGTHDLATLAGWWEGRDLQLRRELGLIPEDGVYQKRLAERAQDRVRLMLALEHAGLLPEGTVLDASGAQALTPELVEAVYAFLAGAPSRVMMVQIEDALGLREQVNMPGTTVEYPNWRRKLPEPLERLAASARVRALAARLAALRRPPGRDRDG